MYDPHLSETSYNPPLFMLQSLKPLVFVCLAFDFCVLYLDVFLLHLNTVYNAFWGPGGCGDTSGLGVLVKIEGKMYLSV